MKTKIISFSLVCALFIGQTNLTALEFDSSSTAGGSWTDSSSGMTYNSFGKKTYSFKKRTSQFTPWFKGRPPAIKAGCGGVSLDGGFAAFLNLEEIGKQLETAISSVGMGVIVVLVQTLPSIGKAFEDVQNLVRKVQSMLQNACQLTVSALSNNPSVKAAKEGMQSDVTDFLGNNFMAEKMKGAVTELDNIERALTCGDSESNCQANSKSQRLAAAIDDPNKHVNKCLTGDAILCEKINNAVGNEVGIKRADLKQIFENKFGDASLGLEDIDLSMMKLKYAIFGVLAVDEQNGPSSVVDADGNFVNYLADTTVVTEKNPPANLQLKWVKPVVKDSEVLDFLTGGKDPSTSEPFKLIIPENFRISTVKQCPISTKAGGCTSSLYYTIVIEKTSEASSNPLEITWEGLYKNTYKTIMNQLKSTNAEPSTRIGVFVPNGKQYLKTLSRVYSENSKLDVQYYADVLARTNVMFAVKYLLLEIKQDAMNYQMSNGNEETIKQYLKYIESTTAQIEKNLKEDYPDDVVYLDHLNNLFEDLNKRSNFMNKSDKFREK